MTSISIMTEKVGMTNVLENGKMIPVTILKLKPHEVFGIKTKQKEGYNAICFSVGEEKKEKKVSKSMLTQFKAKLLKPREKIFEVRVSPNYENFSIEGKEVETSFFETIVGSKVDVQGISIGKGFAGVMKRWNFRGLEATHGVSITHRSHGSTGQRQDPGKVFKGKKMAGHLGAQKVTVQNLEVVLFDKELSVIGVKGAVPGNDGGNVLVKGAVKMVSSSESQTINGLKIIYS